MILEKIINKLILGVGIQTIVLLTTITAYSQSEEFSDEDEAQVSFVDISIDRVYPQNTFKDGLNKNLWGFSLAVLGQRKSKNVDYFGLKFDYAHLGSNTANFALVDERTGSNHFSIQFLYRLYPNFYIGRIEPYFEASLGPQFFYTVTTLTFLDDNTSDVDFDEFDWGLSYGLSFGVSVHVYGQVFIYYKVGYFSGTSITYLIETENTSTIPIENFSPRTSQTNNVRMQFGVAVSF